MGRRPHERRVAPNIYETPFGWRVYVRGSDPVTGRSVKRPVRFGREKTLEELEYFRDTYKLERRRVRRERAEAAEGRRGTLAEDVETYLGLAVVRAMPSYEDRARDLALWVAACGTRPRAALTTRDVEEQLQRWRNTGYAASTVNHRRTALMALFSRLDGRAAANPVRAARLFQEPDLEARGLAYDLVVRILDAIPAVRGYSASGKPTKTRPVRTRTRLEVMAWTGMRPAQLARLRRRDVHLEERWYVSPRSEKGGPRRQPRSAVRKPLSADAVDALARFFAEQCEGPFSTSSARRLFQTAVRRVEAELQEERGDLTFRLPRLRPYDLRHSFGTEMLRRTRSLETVAELLDHSSTRMTKRYALGAIPGVLQTAVEAFEAGASRGGQSIDLTPSRPRPPRRRAR